MKHKIVIFHNYLWIENCSFPVGKFTFKQYDKNCTDFSFIHISETKSSSVEQTKKYIFIRKNFLTETFICHLFISLWFWLYQCWVHLTQVFLSLTIVITKRWAHFNWTFHEYNFFIQKNEKSFCFYFTISLRFNSLTKT